MVLATLVLVRVLFVCTGNLVRSPLSEYLFRQRLAQRGASAIDVHSAGTHAVEGTPALASAVRAGALRGLDLSPHRARRFHPGLVAEGDLVVVMERLHERLVGGLVSGSARLAPGQVRLLGSFAPGGPEEIGDPIGGPEVAFGECLDRIDACLEGLAAHLDAVPGSGRG